MRPMLGPGVDSKVKRRNTKEDTLADSPDGVPTLAEWLKMADHERAKEQERWNPYGGQGFGLVTEITSDFRAKYGHLPGMLITGPGVYHGGYWVIGLRLPFVFDRRTVPATHLGIVVHASGSGELPREFAEGTRRHSYVWAPPHYEAFVDRAAGEIRAQLGAADMSRDDMLSALIGMPFSQWVEACRSSVREGKLEPFE